MANPKDPPGSHIWIPSQGIPEPGLSPRQRQRFGTRKMNGGMITMYEPSNIPDGACQVLSNATCRFDRTQRRVGTNLLTPTKPDSNPVLKTYFFKDVHGNPFQLRLTNLNIYQRTPSSWTLYTHGTSTLAGGPADYWTLATALNQVVAVNNGANEAQLISPSLGSYTNLQPTIFSSSRFRYCTVFYNRVVLANLANADEISVAWSGDGNFGVFDPSVDETAGFDDLLESPSDETDFISGIFGYTNILVIVREQSIWLATKTQVPQNPFNFFAAVPGIGTDCPFAIAQILGGLAWPDLRTGTVWAYQVGGQPEPIGRPIEKTLMSGINDPRTVFASYRPDQNEYTLCIPQVGSTLVNTWTYNFRTRTWCQGQYDSIVSIDDTALGISGVTIEQLVGTIENLQGTIEGLSPGFVNVLSRVFGRNQGDILVENQTAFNDQMTLAASGDVVPGSGIVYTTQITSRAFEIEERYIYVREVRVEYTQQGGGVIQLQYAKDGGVNENSWINAEQFSTSNLGATFLLRFVSNIKVRRFAFRLFIQGGAFEIIAFEVHHYIGGIALI